jgi:hypothetical protein
LFATTHEARCGPSPPVTFESFWRLNTYAETA